MKFPRLRKLCLGISVLFLATSGLRAQDIIRGPYLQTGTPTEITIKWRTSVATDSEVDYGPTPNNLNQVVQSAALTTEHEVILAALQAESKYYYSVGTTTAVLAGGDDSHYFVTSPVAGTARPTRLWVLGDSGTANSDAAAVRDAFGVYSASRPAQLLLMLGDNAYQDGTDAEYQDAVFDMYPSWLRNTVTWSTLGNHDGHTADSATQTGPYYDIFALPTMGEAGGLGSGTEAYYSFDHGNIHFIVLESYETDRSPAGAMLTWAENDIMVTTQEWIIAFWHHPPYTKGSHNSDTEGQLIDMRQNALPILEDYGVDLVLTGHSHSYERSFLLDGHYGLSTTLLESMKKDGGDGREDGDGAYEKLLGQGTGNEGTVYAVAGSSGKISNAALNHPAMFISLGVLGSMVLDVYGNRLDAVFLDSTGAVQDYFTLTKGQDNLPPVIVSTQALDAGTVLVEFAEPVDQTSAENPANYALDQGVTVNGAALQADGTSVLLTTSPLLSGLTYLLLVNNVFDLAGHAIAPNSQAIFTYADVVTARFQDGVYPSAGQFLTRDTYLSENNPGFNYGNSTTLPADGDDPSSSGLDKRTLLSWDVSSIPQTAQVQSVSITIDVTNRGGNYPLYEVFQPWLEDEATWNDYDNGQAWEVAGADGGGDRGSALLGAVDTGSTGPLTVQLNPDGVAAVQGWVEGTWPNYGFLLADDSSTNGLDFISREHGTASQRPLLSIDYTNICEQTFDLTAGEWKQISLACDPGTATQVSQVFGAYLAGTHEQDWIVFEREYNDTTGDQYQSVGWGEPMEVGRGYWIKTLQADQSVTVRGLYNVPVEVDLEGDAGGRYNLMGYPFEFDVCWADVEVINPAATPQQCANTPTCTLGEADAAGFISRIAHKWASGNYAAFDGQTPGLKGTLAPWDGFWVEAFAEGIKLKIPANPAGDCEALAETVSQAVAFRKSKNKKETANWFVRLIAESGDLADPYNVLGQLSDSVQDYDSHDLKELSPFGSSYLSIVFPHLEWEEKSGDYTSDFHSVQSKIKDEWYFEVVSSDPEATVTLTWEGEESLLEKASLLDVETGKRYRVKRGDSYTFTMNGTRRGFQWLVN